MCAVSSSFRQIMFDCWPTSLDWRLPSSDCSLRQPVRTMILLFVSIALCCPCRPTVCVASSVFDVLPTTYPSTTVLVIWQPCALQRCPKYDRLRLRTCPSNSRILCQVLVECYRQFFLHSEHIGSRQNSTFQCVMKLIGEFEPCFTKHVAEFGRKWRRTSSYLSSTKCEVVRI